ncbi:hypothetical protein TcWFU_002587 [Taenia crassiceps]|uniref:Uncharacterized protein n=1 Tax=Taenia crassiceps TaxID=6207 RepID=A0ABR4QK06_9CEST
MGSSDDCSCQFHVADASSSVGEPFLRTGDDIHSGAVVVPTSAIFIGTLAGRFTRHHHPAVASLLSPLAPFYPARRGDHERGGANRSKEERVWTSPVHMGHARMSQGDVAHALRCSDKKLQPNLLRRYLHHFSPHLHLHLILLLLCVIVLSLWFFH